MLKIGEKLDNYEILGLLGSGGFGRVWRARDLTVKGREVAIKELADPTTERLEGFLREMEILAALKHPGIVTFHHALNGGQYLVMEYIPEGSLRRHLRPDAGMPIEKAAGIVSSLCDVLTAVHDKRVVHRDLKPDNIFLQGKAVRVGDFGIAEIIQTGQEALRSGTLPYMAPEIFKKDFGPADHRTDIYAAGIILIELLTGRRPFEASDAGQLIYRICFEAPPIPREIPAWLQGILQKALAKSPNLRFQSAQEMKHALEAKLVPQLYPAALIKANRANVAAESLIGRGRINAALSHVEQGLTQYPEHPRLIFTKARCLLILRRAKEALPLLLRARQLDPGIQCEMELGYAQIQLRDYGKAISSLTEYTRRRPEDLRSFNLLMETLYLSGANEQAMEIGKALCAEDPVFLNNGLLATALTMQPNRGLEIFKTATKHLETLPGYIQYNILALEHLKEIGAPRIRGILFFAPFPHTIMPGKTLRPKLKPLRVEIQSAGKRSTSKTFESGFVSVGRTAGLDIALENDGKASRFHGILYYRDAVYHYRDLNSTLGSTLGGKPIKGDVALVGMETIKVGDTLLSVSY